MQLVKGKEAGKTSTLPGRDVTADWQHDCTKNKNNDSDGGSWWRGFTLLLPPTTYVVSQTVGLVGYGQSGQLPQSQLALHGLVCAHDEGLPRGGRESQRLNWGEKERRIID